jgi:hypothetical protein
MSESVPLGQFEQDAFLRAAVGLPPLVTDFVFGLECYSAISSLDPILVTMVGRLGAVTASSVRRRTDGESWMLLTYVDTISYFNTNII